MNSGSSLAVDSIEVATDVAMEAITVVQIIGSLRIGGAEKHFVNLFNAMPVHKKVAVVIARNQPEINFTNQLDNDIDVEHVAIRKRFAFLGVWKLVRLLRSTGCHVVHTHMFWANLYGSIAAKLAGVPVVITTEHGENKWKNWIHRWLEKNIISRLSDFRFCVSESILSRRRDLDGVPAAKLGLIVNGTVLPAETAIRRKGPVAVIGSIGRIVSQKNYRLFVDVIAELKKAGHKVQGCLVGDGPDKEEIESHIRLRGLKDDFRLPGMVTDPDVWFRKFDLYAMTSDQEGQPISLLEAMSYRLPIVATDVGAITKTLQHNYEGLVVPPRDVAAFAQALERFLVDDEFATECGAHARVRVQREFSIQAIAKKYVDCYVNLLARER